MNTSFRLRVCIRDAPGALLRILETLSGQTQIRKGPRQIEQQIIHENYDKIVPDIHMFTLKRCSRFPILYTTNPRIAGSLFLKSHYLFHAIIELKLIKESGEEETIAVLELHACLITSDYGVKASNFYKFIKSLTKPSLSDTNNNHPELWENFRIPNEVIYVGTLSPLNTNEIREYPSSLERLKLALQTIVIENNENPCPERGTCPLGFILHNKENLEKLYKHKFTRIFLEHQNQELTCKLKQIKRNDVYLTFIRDHECYTRNKSFEEYYGVVLHSEDKKNQGTSFNENFTPPFSVNSVIVDVIYVNNKPGKIYDNNIDNKQKNIVALYINNMLKDIVKKNEDNIENSSKKDKEYISKLSPEDIVKESERYYIVSKYFTCEDPSCDITRCFMPKLSLPRSEEL